MSLERSVTRRLSTHVAKSGIFCVYLTLVRCDILLPRTQLSIHFRAWLWFGQGIVRHVNLMDSRTFEVTFVFAALHQNFPCHVKTQAIEVTSMRSPRNQEVR